MEKEVQPSAKNYYAPLSTESSLMPSIAPSPPLFRDVAASLNPKYPKTKESLCPFYRRGRAG